MALNILHATWLILIGKGNLIELIEIFENLNESYFSFYMRLSFILLIW